MEIQVPMALLEVDTEIQEIRQEATVGQQEAMAVHQVEVTEVHQVEVMAVMEGIKQSKSFV